MWYDKGVAQEVERLLRQAAEPRFRLVHRQLQLGHHPPHHVHGLFGRAVTADDEVVRVVDDSRDQTSLMTAGFPSLHKSSHVDIGQQW